MTDISSISFSETSYQISPPSSRSASIELGYLLNQFGFALDQVKEFSGQATELYYKMAGLIRQTQQKLIQVKRQNLQAHHKCLEHIQILLYQKDYKQALLKIDQYKKMQLTDISFEQEQKIIVSDYKDVDQFTFQQAKAIINSQFADFELKQKIWLLYATQYSDSQQKLKHITCQQIQQAQLEKFKKQFNIGSQNTQEQQNERKLMSTPEKKCSKSISYLKSEVKKAKNSSLKQKKTDKQKSTGKLQGSNKRSSQKRTQRKKGNKDQQQSKTSKKIISEFV